MEMNVVLMEIKIFIELDTSIDGYIGGYGGLYAANPPLGGQVHEWIKGMEH